MLFLSVLQTVLNKWSNAMTASKMSEHLVNQENQVIKHRSKPIDKIDKDSDRFVKKEFIQQLNKVLCEEQCHE